MYKVIAGVALVGTLILSQFLPRLGGDTDRPSRTFAPANAQDNSTISGTAHATDGDTIKLDQQIRVRLSGVAAPERDEVGGSEATSFMARLVNGQKVRCELDGTRSHDRVVGTCFLGSRDIGQAVIAAGLARDCPRYSHGLYAASERPEAASLPLPRYCQPR